MSSGGPQLTARQDFPSRRIILRLKILRNQRKNRNEVVNCPQLVRSSAASDTGKVVERTLPCVLKVSTTLSSFLWLPNRRATN